MWEGFCKYLLSTFKAIGTLELCNSINTIRILVIIYQFTENFRILNEVSADCAQ